MWHPWDSYEIQTGLDPYTLWYAWLGYSCAYSFFLPFCCLLRINYTNWTLQCTLWFMKFTRIDFSEGDTTIIQTNFKLTYPSYNIWVYRFNINLKTTNTLSLNKTWRDLLKSVLLRWLLFIEIQTLREILFNTFLVIQTAYLYISRWQLSCLTLMLVSSVPWSW